MKLILILITCIAININLFGQDQNISKSYVFDGEPFIAMNPNNPQHLVIAWMGFQAYNYIVIKTKTSFNGGKTWSQTNYIPHTNPAFGAADPSIDFDDSGNVFLCYIDYDVAIDSGFVYVRKSSDGGLTWGNPVEVINAHSDTGKYPIDRPWLCIDRSGGIYNNSIYVTTMNPNVFGYIPPPYNPYFMRSKDGGSSFESWRYLDTTGWLAGNFIVNAYASPTVAVDGTFYSAYPSWVYNQNPNPQYILVSSTDGGDSFKYNSIFDLSNHTAVTDTIAKKGYILLSNPADEAHLIFLCLLNDYGDSDIFMWESTDSGNNWSSQPTRINDDPIGNNKHQDLIWANFDTDGDLVVAWRDRRNAPDTTFTTSAEVWGAYRNKDSINFFPNFKISQTLAAYDTILSYSGNDFMSVKFRNDTLHATWGDVRNGYLNIYYCKKDIAGTLLSVIQIAHDPIENIQLFPNPTTGIITIKNIFEIKDFKLFVYDNSGQMVYKTKNKSKIDLSFLSNGTYFIKIKTPYKDMYGKIIKIE